MDKIKIGKRCKAARGNKTKYQVAKAAGLTIGQIERIEDGKENYTVDILNKYLRALSLAFTLQ